MSRATMIFLGVTLYQYQYNASICYLHLPIWRMVNQPQPTENGYNEKNPGRYANVEFLWKKREKKEGVGEEGRSYSACNIFFFFLRSKIRRRKWAWFSRAEGWKEGRKHTSKEEKIEEFIEQNSGHIIAEQYAEGMVLPSMMAEGATAVSVLQMRRQRQSEERAITLLMTIWALIYDYDSRVSFLPLSLSAYLVAITINEMRWTQLLLKLRVNIYRSPGPLSARTIISRS